MIELRRMTSIWVLFKIISTVTAGMKSCTKPKALQYLQKSINTYCQSRQHPAKAPLFARPPTHQNLRIESTEIAKYQRLASNIQDHMKSMHIVENYLISVNNQYYLNIIKLVEAEQEKMKNYLLSDISSYRRDLSKRLELVMKAIEDIRGNKIPSKHQDILHLATIQKPTFQIQNGKSQQISTMLEAIRPDYLRPTFKKQLTFGIAEGEENSRIKKEEKVPALDLSCNEELTWGETTRKHEIVSEVIFEEPSSREDSLISNEIC